MATTLYVLLREHNAYDQFGEYYCGVYSSYEKAAQQIDHMGRVNDEDYWYSIKQVLLDAPKEEED